MTVAMMMMMKTTMMIHLHLFLNITIHEGLEDKQEDHLVALPLIDKLFDIV